MPIFLKFSLTRNITIMRTLIPCNGLINSKFTKCRRSLSLKTKHRQHPPFLLRLPVFEFLQQQQKITQISVALHSNTMRPMFATSSKNEEKLQRKKNCKGRRFANDRVSFRILFRTNFVIV